MTRIAFLTIILSVIGLSAFAKKPKADYPRAEIKVSYNYHKKSVRSDNSVVEFKIPFILLANSSQSKFYCPSTERLDSLKSTPSGRAQERIMFDAAVKAYVENKDRSAMDGVTYRTQLYVIKDYAKAISTTYDKAGLGEHGYYDEPFSEIDWRIVEDSTKTVLGYECLMAKADYHGRDWTAWFAPEIPVHDGPWKLCGLPGLILEASEAKGHHIFVADGIERSNQPIYPIFSKDKYTEMDRIEMLKSERNYRDNSHSMAKAATDGKLDLGPDAPPQREYDFLETDYR